jgi:tetratricopeptide (TPR) repeat protein
MISRASRLLALLAALCAPALAQRETDPSLPGASFEISGQVRATGGQKVVANVMVRLERFSGAVVDQIATDSTGRFRFSRLIPGQYVVSAKGEGFVARTQQIDISRAIPRQYVLLQLEPEEETFRATNRKAGVIDARVPEEARRELEKAQAALRDKKRDEATLHLERAASLYPDFYEAQMMLGDAYMEARQWAKAEAALRRALRAGPRTSGALITLGEASRRQKKFAEAEQSLVEALKLDRGSWQGHFTLGRVYWEKNDFLKAAPHVGQALKINPTYPEGHLLAGNIFMRLNMPENALAAYEEYLRLAPDGEFAPQMRESVGKLRKMLAPKK